METERIEFRDVHRSFTPRGSEPIHAVRGFDAVLRAGETVALLGPNGAGKSTTIDMLLGLLDPDGGTISVFGRTPLEAVDAGLVGAMLQTGSLPRDLTIREIVTLIAATYRTPLAVDEALRRAGITDIAKQRTDSLSGGQTQRVRFAMALVADPSLLVLDEPTVAMDVGSRNDFWQTMRDVASSGATILFATHYLEEAAAFADRVILMAHGRVVADGPVTEISGLVGGRVIRATVEGVQASTLEALPGVTRAEQRGDGVALTCTDSDAALRALLERHPSARDIEITGAGLEAAFLSLTSDEGAAAEVSA